MSHSLPTISLIVLIVAYGVCILVLSIYGFNSLGLAILYLVNRRKTDKRPHPAPAEGKWPRVTIQLPIYNESTIVERLLKSVIDQDYPRDCYQIQVLDDSNDETTELAQKLVDQYRGQGWDICLIHRNDRKGYKAGALAEGLVQASGEFLAIFDADFTPRPEWLRSVMVMFDDPKIGCVQTRWGASQLPV